MGGPTGAPLSGFLGTLARDRGAIVSGPHRTVRYQPGLLYPTRPIDSPPPPPPPETVPAWRLLLEVAYAARMAARSSAARASWPAMRASHLPDHHRTRRAPADRAAW